MWSVDLSSGLDDIRVEGGYIYLLGPSGPRALDYADTAPAADQSRASKVRNRVAAWDDIAIINPLILPTISLNNSLLSSLSAPSWPQPWASPLAFPIVSSTTGWVNNLPGSLESPNTPSSPWLSSRVSPINLSYPGIGQYPEYPGGWIISPSIGAQTTWLPIQVPSSSPSYWPLEPLPLDTQPRLEYPIRVSMKNSLKRSVYADIIVALLDFNRKEIGRQQYQMVLEAAKKNYELRLKGIPTGTKLEDFSKYIVQYQFTGDGLALSDERSLFSLADKMEVRINGPDSFYAGEPTYLGVHAFVQGYDVPIDEAEVTVDLIRQNKSERLYTGKTGDEGLAKALLTIPENARQGSAKIKFRVSSSLGIEEMVKNIEIVRMHKVFLTTDKPLYQPGQTIHIRTLTLRKPDLEPDADQTVIIEVEDPKGNKVSRVAPKTSSFGLACTDFVLGTDITMGMYTIRAVRGEGSELTTSEKKVTVDRYVLPKFKVDLKTDEEYYQPGDLVKGTIQTKYLFGKPVTKAKVTVDAYKYDADFNLFQSMSGQTDSEGFYTFDLRLPSYFVGHPLEQGGALVRLDVTVKDSASHEEKVTRELTVTKTPINIRLIPESREIVTSVENILYLLTTDPKGQGLATTNTVSLGSRIVQTVSTDEQGFGKVILPPDPDMAPGSSLVLHVLSSAGSHTAEADIAVAGSTQARILLRTDMAVYTVGQTMTVDLYTPEFEGSRAFVDLIRDRQTLLTTGVDIVNGYGSLPIDLDSDMAGTVVVEAYYISGTQETASDIFRDKKIIYVNQPDQIQISTTLNKAQYLPGEQARIDFKVTPAQPTALGITIVDEAVYALQDNTPGLLRAYFNMEEEIMKPRYWPLSVPFEEAVTDSEPDSEVQKAAEVAFAEVEEPSDPALNESSYPSLVQRMKESLVSSLDADADDIAKDLAKEYIYSSYAYQSALNRGKAFAYSDPWGNPYTLEVGYNQLTLSTWGPDEVQGTLDDLKFTKPYEPAPPKPQPQSSASAAGYVYGIPGLSPYGYMGLYSNVSPYGGGLYSGLYSGASWGIVPQGIGYGYGQLGSTYAGGIAGYGGAYANSGGYATSGSGGGYSAGYGGYGGGYSASFSAANYGASGGGGYGYSGGGSSVSGSSSSQISNEAQTQAAYLAPSEEGGGGSGQTTEPGQSVEEVQEPRKIRRDFPETLLWEPSLITDENGLAYLDANMADSITTWRMSTTASTLDGKLGGRTDGIVVFQDFFIDLDLPAALTRNDEISLPVAVYNYLGEAQTLRVKIDMGQTGTGQTGQSDSLPWFELLDEQEKVLRIEPGQVTSVNFRIKATRAGWHELTVFGYGTRMSDAISRRIEVMPDGQETQVSFSERLKESEATQVVHIPAEAMDDASGITVKIYPCLFSQVVEGLDKLFKVPHGCFGQTTAVTWPNVLVLDYMLSTKQVTPEIEMTARQYINQGYQRLLTFECTGGGFDLFGQAPGNPILTAYGLMEFADMARVQFVDPAMIERTQKWLASQQKQDGSWSTDKWTEYFNALNSSLRSTAYATWALIHSGYTDDSPIRLGQSYIKQQMKNTGDNYTLALCANALLEGDPLDKDGLAILDRLEERKIEEGDRVHWTSVEKESMTYSKGDNLELETTGLIAYAFIKANWRYPKTIDKVLNYIVQQKDAFGIWGQVESTIISLKVLIKAISGQHETMNAEISVGINGQPLDKDDLPILKINPIDSQILRCIDLKPYTVEGDNTVTLSLSGGGNLLYQIIGTYYLPWNNVNVPASPPLTIDLTYDKKNLPVDDTILCTVTVKNNQSDTITRMGMVDLGIPPGFTVLYEDFQKAIESKKIFKYESTNRQLTLYLRPISYGMPISITYRLQAKYPLKVATPTSTVYDYNNPGIRDEEKPVILTVY